MTCFSSDSQKENSEEEKEEHEKLAETISKMELERIILMGPRVSKYTYLKLISLLEDRIIIEKFENPKEVLEYLKANLKGRELLIFKGSQSLILEGVIENLLADKKDVSKLPRREKIWGEKRKKSLKCVISD